MPILFAITVVAFVALLWAAVSTARHIRRARRREEMAMDTANQRAAFPPPPPPPAHETSAASASATTLAQNTPEQPLPPPPTTSLTFAAETKPVRFPLSSQRLQQAESQLAHFNIARDSSPQPGPPKRPPTSAAPRKTYAPYFNENMGDLSDPIPSPRLRDRARHR